MSPNKKKPVTNIGASVRAQLLNIARESGQDYNRVLIRYAQERLLYRFSVSPFPILHCGGGRIADRRRVQGVVPDQSGESVDGQWAAQESERIKMQRARRIGLLS